MDTQHITNDSPNTQVPSSTIVPEENIIVPPTHGMRFQKHIDAFIHHPIVALAALLSVAAIGTLIARSTLTPQTASVEAGTSTVTVSLQPQTATFTTGGIVQLWVKTYKPLGFVSARIKFDKTKVRLAGEVNTSPSPLARVIQKTSLSESNAPE